MLLNKNQVKKVNQRNVLHKVKKQWVLYSTALVIFAAGGVAFGNQTVHADSNNSSSNVTTSITQLGSSSTAGTSSNADVNSNTSTQSSGAVSTSVVATANSTSGNGVQNSSPASEANNNASSAVTLGANEDPSTPTSAPTLTSLQYNYEIKLTDESNSEVISNAVDENGSSVATDFTRTATFSRSATSTGDGSYTYGAWQVDSDGISPYTFPTNIKGWKMNAQSASDAGFSLADFTAQFDTINSAAQSKTSTKSGPFPFIYNVYTTVPYTKESVTPSVTAKPEVINYTYNYEIKLIDNKTGSLISNAVDANGSSVNADLIRSATFSRSASTDANGSFAYSPWKLDTASISAYPYPTIKGYKLVDSNSAASGFDLTDFNNSFAVLNSVALSVAAQSGFKSDFSFTYTQPYDVSYAEESVSSSSVTPSSAPSSKPSASSVPSSIPTPSSSVAPSATSLVNGFSVVSSSSSAANSSSVSSTTNSIVNSQSSSSEQSVASNTATVQGYEMYNYQTRLIKAKNGQITIFIEPRYTDSQLNGSNANDYVVNVKSNDGKTSHVQQVTLDEYNAMLVASGQQPITQAQLEQLYQNDTDKKGILKKDHDNKKTFISITKKAGKDVLINTKSYKKGFYPTHDKDIFKNKDNSSIRVKVTKRVKKVTKNHGTNSKYYKAGKKHHSKSTKHHKMIVKNQH